LENVVEDPQAPGAGLVLTSGTTSAPILDPPELARSIEAGLARGTQDLADAARRVRAGSDPEAIHDLRVAARRLLIALRVWEPLCRVRLHRVLTRQLRRERRRFGSARELEMNVAWLESRVPSSDVAVSTGAIAGFARMKRRVRRRRRQAASRLRP